MAKKTTAAPERGYRDLDDHLAALEKEGLLRVVDIPINKDTELFPLVRWQVRGGVADEDRKAWLFTNVTDSKGKKYDMPVLIGAWGGSEKIYSMALGCALEDSHALWARALSDPIPPREISEAPCQEVVIEGEALDQPGNALDALPVPISTPGWDNAPFLSGTGFVTKDPETGLQNFGTYRGQIKAPRRFGLNTSTELRAGGYGHWLKYKERGERMPCAYVVGGPPVLAYAAVWKAPEDVDEVAIAGGLAGAPLNVVKARTVDLMVPADAEIIIEGYVDTEYLEPEGPYGEAHGYVNTQEFNGFVEVTAITHRTKPKLITYLSQIHPNEFTAIRCMVHEFGYMRHLRDHLGIKGVKRVTCHQPLTGNRKFIFVTLERGVPRTEVWRALYGIQSQQRASGKFVTAINEDIDPKNLDSVFWAIAFRCSPHLDMEIIKHKDPGHGPSESVPGGEDSALLIDATLKQDFPPVALPKREYMERAREIWEDTLGLPKLTPEAPWFGYPLGFWPDELAEEAQRAVESDYWENGRRAAQRRRKDIPMNTEVWDVEED
ncbi:MAG: UbiD family decarboxylase [Alphaproteobacteria bacterium]